MTALKPSQNVLELVRSVALVSVRTVYSEARFLGIKAGDTLEKMKLTKKSGGLKSPDEPETVRSMVGIECVVLAHDGDNREAAILKCDIALDYKVRDASLFHKLTEDDCNQFAELNGVYNAWPYLREFCQSASLRMGLPFPITLPTLAPGPPPSPNGAANSDDGVKTGT